MPDEFADARARMREYHDRLDAFIFMAGSTLLQCQAFEDVLRQYKLAVHEYRDGMKPQEFEARLSESRKKETLGGILRDLEKKVSISADTKALLDEFLAERNWFIHHLWYQEAGSPYKDELLIPLIERMKDIQARSLHLQKEFLGLVEEAAQKRGATREQLAAMTRANLNQMFGDRDTR